MFYHTSLLPLFFFHLIGERAPRYIILVVRSRKYLSFKSICQPIIICESDGLVRPRNPNLGHTQRDNKIQLQLIIFNFTHG